MEADCMSVNLKITKGLLFGYYHTSANVRWGFFGIRYLFWSEARLSAFSSHVQLCHRLDYEQSGDGANQASSLAHHSISLVGSL